MGFMIDRSLASAVAAIILGATAGIVTALSAQDQPLAGQVWVPYVVAALTAIAALLRRSDDGSGSSA